MRARVSRVMYELLRFKPSAKKMPGSAVRYEKKARLSLRCSLGRRNRQVSRTTTTTTTAVASGESSLARSRLKQGERGRGHVGGNLQMRLLNFSQ